MANNFFGKLRGLVSTAWSEADTEPTHNSPAPTQSAGKPSSVERYLAKQAAAQAVTEGKALTGVEKYMARIAGATQAAEVSKGPLTSVDKYLAKQAGTLKTEPAKPAAPLSKVDKYLASQAAPAKAKAPVPEAPAKKIEEVAKEAPTAKKKKSEAVKAGQTAVAPKEVVKKETAAKKAVDVVDLSVGATQCQASTTKGTQCRNTLRLNQLQQTIDNKTYLFAACNQHNNDAFKPFQQV